MKMKVLNKLKKQRCQRKKLSEDTKVEEKKEEAPAEEAENKTDEQS